MRELQREVDGACRLAAPPRPPRRQSAARHGPMYARAFQPCELADDDFAMLRSML